MPVKEINLNYKKNPKEGRKRKKGEQIQIGQIENKEQD